MGFWTSYGWIIAVGGFWAVKGLEKLQEYTQTKEYEKKAKWDADHPNIPDLKRLAQNADETAQYKLGLAYYHGRSVPQDYAEAFTWMRLAADAGHTDAQAVLGAMYFAGHGRPQDRLLSHVYFNLAAAKGHSAAKESRDTVAPLLSGPQLEQAHRLAREWAPVKS